MTASSRRFLPLAFFTIVAVFLTWPLAVHPASRLAALQGPGDPYLYVWVLGWDLRTLFAHPTWLLSGRVFDANIFHPAQGTLAYSDHLLLQAIAVSPVYALTHNLTLCYNVVLFLSLVLSAWAMYVFVAEVTRSEVAAWVAGFVWGFCPYRFTQLLHVQLQALYWLPLALLFLFRLAARGRRRDAVWLGVTTSLQAISSVYLGVIGGLGLVVATITLTAAKGHWLNRRWFGRLVEAVAVAAVLTAPAVWPYWRSQQREGFARNLFEASHGSAAIASYVQAPPTNVLYGRTGWLRPASGGGGLLRRREGPEQDLFPGFVVVALAVVGGWRARKLKMRAVAGLFLAMGLTGFVLSLGPDGVRPLYSVLYDWVFGFHAVRAPARFSLLVFFALAGLAGLGAASLRRGNADEVGPVGRVGPGGPVRSVGGDDASGRRHTSGWSARALPAAILAVMAVMGLEFWNGSLDYAPAPEATSATGRWLASAPGRGAVLYLPLVFDVESTPFMVASLEHGRPILNGYSGQRPTFYPALVETMNGFPSADALLALRDLGVQFVVTQTPLAAVAPLVERVRLNDGVVYELAWTSEIEAALMSATTLVPPDAGPAPFKGGETARYQVRWLGGPMTIPAGEVTLSAEPNSDGGFRFTVRATTADWVKRFYSADDALETIVTALLLPVSHRQELHEGRRDQRRTVLFEPEHRRLQLTTGQGGDRVTLPLSPSARDPISAFYYVRTLPLAPGYRVRLPLSDLGRSSFLDVFVGSEETITIDGRPQPALEIKPRITNRVQRTTPLQITLWLSRDERKIPLAIEVRAAFGAVRVELSEYRDR